MKNLSESINKLLLRTILLGEKHATYVSVLLPVLLLLYALLTSPPDLSNKVTTAFLPDQVDYHTCAVNHVSGYGFMRSGKMNDRLDYKMELTDSKALLQHEILAGMKRLDRFPGTPLFLSAIYKTFGVNPTAAKILMLVLLMLFLFSIPLLIRNIWGSKGFWAGLTAVVFLFYYLLPYTANFTADLMSVFINFYIIYCYIKIRQHFTFKYIIPLALLSGVSILFKPSLMFFMVFMFADLFILSIKQYKRMLPRFLVLAVLFFSIWVPYNLWSMLQSRKIIKNAKVITEALDRDNPSTELINSLADSLKASFYIKTGTIEIDQSHIDYYKTHIKPTLDLKRSLSLERMAGYSNELKFISFLAISARIKPEYFMVQLIPTVGALELHNEYITGGFYYNAWHLKEESYYNKDGLSHKSDMYRMLSFYRYNPTYFFKNAHSKLKSYFEHNTLIPIFILSTLLFLLLKFILHSHRKNKKYIIPVLSVILLSAFILKASLLPYIFLGSIIFSVFDEVLKKYFPLPLIFIFISLYLFPVITYGNSRFMIYYDTYFFILFGIVTIELLSLLNNLKNNKKTA